MVKKKKNRGWRKSTPPGRVQSLKYPLELLCRFSVSCHRGFKRQNFSRYAARCQHWSAADCKRRPPYVVPSIWKVRFVAVKQSNAEAHKIPGPKRWMRGRLSEAAAGHGRGESSRLCWILHGWLPWTQLSLRMSYDQWETQRAPPTRPLSHLRILYPVLAVCADLVVLKRVCQQFRKHKLILDFQLTPWNTFDYQYDTLQPPAVQMRHECD